MADGHAIVIEGRSVPVFGACVATCPARAVAVAAYVTAEHDRAAEDLLRGLGRMPAGYVCAADLLHGLHRLPANLYAIRAQPFAALNPLLGSLLGGAFGGNPPAPLRADAGLHVALFGKLQRMPFFTLEFDPAKANFHAHHINAPATDDLDPWVREVMRAALSPASGDAPAPKAN